MPTMSKLFSAVLMAVVGYYAADKVAGHLPEEIPPGLVRQITALFGIFVGWRFLGRRVGTGMQHAAGMGISASVVLVLVCLLYFSGKEMIHRAMRMAYGGNPFEALQDMVQIAIEYSNFLLYSDVIAVLVLGGIAVGFFVELVSRRWS